MQLDSEKYHNSKQVKPATIVWMLVLLNLVLGLMVLLFPESERSFVFNGTPPFVHLHDESDSNSKEDVKLQFVSATDLFYPKERIVVDLDSVLGNLALDTMVEDTVVVDTSFKEPEIDKKIQYVKIERSVLYGFFEALLEVENGSEKLIRILHYGDSQLEGDRISDYLRNKMQNRFGGYGPGIVLPIDVSHSRVSIRQSESRDWEKYAIYSRKRHPKRHYGIGGSSYMFTGKYFVKIGEDTLYQNVYDSMISKKKLLVKPKLDTTPKNDSSMFEIVEIPFDSTKFHIDTVYKPIYERKNTEYSWLRFRCASRSYPRVRKFNQVQLLYSSDDTVNLIVSVDGIDRIKHLPPAPYGSKRLIHQGWVTNEVMLKFTGASPVVFGVLLDGESGVAVDNFPMRGSSGTGYSMINKSIYKRQLESANVNLIIMQYGINVIPNPQKNYDFYKRMFSSELAAIKQANPGVNILVIGPSDMSRKVAGEYVSYPNITKVRDAMQQAASDNDCAFWDLYSVMGGENAMVGWVNNKPALAAKDYTHFNSRGATYIGEMLFNAIMSDYTVWKSTKSVANP
ncbi:MAG: lysophospholipase L1-like esterase [Bacteroidia bacterium]